MSHLRTLGLALIPLVLSSVGGCSDEDEAQPAGGSQTPVVPFNGNCTTAKWAHVSDACWSCMCGACAATLNVCNEGCTGAMECAIEKKTLVNDTAQIPCEVRGTGTECLNGASGEVINAVIAFDGCLISAPKPSGFRVCEDVCQIPYPGDVCERYPM